MKQLLFEKFSELFGADGDIRYYFAPGRVNLIGEHTDYNGGHVFPCALTIGTYAVVKKRNDKELNFFSINMEAKGIIKAETDSIDKGNDNKWARYPLGVIKTFQDKGYKVENGFDIVYYGNIPNSSGLSSSASIEVLTAIILCDLYSFNIDLLNIALLCQKAENEFVGVKCGILDQFAIAMGRKDSAVFLDTNTMKYEYAPLKLNGMKIVIMNTKVARGLADSKYNERRSECEAALAQLQKELDISSLGELSIPEFEKYSYLITDEINRKRAKHAVYENQRTIEAVEALNRNDIVAFGKLMIDSHHSLQYDYEVTGKELDTIVEATLEQKGVYGARMTGAGFGGCAVSIVDENATETIIENVGRIYKEKTGLNAEFYVVDAGEGPSRLYN